MAVFLPSERFAACANKNALQNVQGVLRFKDPAPEIGDVCRDPELINESR